jgi:hypothetical protein
MGFNSVFKGLTTFAKLTPEYPRNSSSATAGFQRNTARPHSCGIGIYAVPFPWQTDFKMPTENLQIKLINLQCDANLN